jgi:hypothetical protein
MNANTAKKAIETALRKIQISAYLVTSPDNSARMSELNRMQFEVYRGGRGALIGLAFDLGIKLAETVPERYDVARHEFNKALEINDGSWNF